MSEVDVDGQIKRFWARSGLGEYQPDGQGAAWSAIRRYVREKLSNPDMDNPMRLAVFFKYADTVGLREIMARFYKHLWKVDYLEPMGKSIAFMVIKGLSPDETANHLATHPEDAASLGYKRLPDGTYQTPCGETFRYNITKRFGVEGIKMLDCWLVEQVVTLAKNHGIDFGQILYTDGIPIESVETDKEAKFNPHYEVTGYKVILTGAYHKEAGELPLVANVTGITAYEGQFLVPHIRAVRDLGIQPFEWWVDGAYPSIRTIAITNVQENVQLHYDIAAKWRYYASATLDQVQMEYQRHHREDDFRTGASVHYMMSYLVKHGEYETVGRMFRNDKMAEKEECPDGFLDRFHQRNGAESQNDLFANDWELRKAVVRKGKKHMDLLVALRLFSMHMLAYVRLSNGITSRLVSKVGLT